MLLRADEALRIEDRLSLLEIVHNPYRDEKDARRVFERLRQDRETLVAGPQKRGIRVGDLARAFGGVQVRYRMPDGRVITKEEAEAERDGHGDRQHTSGQAGGAD